MGTDDFIGLPSSVPSSEFCEAFAQAMANRMAVSFFKYGAVADAYPHKINALESLRERLKLYLDGGTVKGVHVEPGNTEWLIDAANFAMIEFMRPSVPRAHFTPQDSETSPGRNWLDGSTTERRNVNEFTYSKEGD